jgi:hypothetical protein
MPAAIHFPISGGLELSPSKVSFVQTNNSMSSLRDPGSNMPLFIPLIVNEIDDLDDNQSETLELPTVTLPSSILNQLPEDSNIQAIDSLPFALNAPSSQSNSQAGLLRRTSMMGGNR